MASLGPIQCAFADTIDTDGLGWEDPFEITTPNGNATWPVTANTIRDHDVRITLNGTTVTGNNLANNNDWSDLEWEEVTYGGENDMCGVSITTAELKANPVLGLAVSLLENNDPVENDPSDYLYGNDFDLDDLPDSAILTGFKFTLERRMNLDGGGELRRLKLTVHFNAASAAAGRMLLLGAG